MNDDKAFERRGLMAKIPGTNRAPMGAYTDLEEDVPSSSVRDWLWYAAVWPRPTAKIWPYDERHLAAAQEQWDKSNQFVQRRREMEAEREAALKAKQDQRDAEAEARRQQAMEAEKQELRTRFLGSNPSAGDQDFERNYPALRDDLMRQRMATEEDAARRSMRPKL